MAEVDRAALEARPDWGMVRGEIAAVIAAWYGRGDVDERGMTKAGRCADRVWPSIKPHVDAEVADLLAQVEQQLRDVRRVSARLRDYRGGFIQEGAMRADVADLIDAALDGTLDEVMRPADARAT